MTRVISLSDEAYDVLKKRKNEGESFSDVVIKIARGEKKPLSAFFGSWPGGKKELDHIEKELAEDRKRAKTRDVAF